jgi:Tfp pilus assembly protein PilF
MAKINRNDPCLCGSGKKYKHCCIQQQHEISFDLQKGIQRAWEFFRRGFFKEALAHSAQVLTFSPQNLSIHYLMGLIYLQDGQIDRAIEKLSAIHKRSSPNPELLANLGFAYHEKGEVTLAECYYEKAITHDPYYANAYYNLHALELDKKAFDLAIASLEKVVSINNFDLDALFMLGLIYSYTHQETQASIYFKKLENASPLIKARVEAWQYLKIQSQRPPQMTGSITNTLKLAMNEARLEGLVLEFGVRHGNSINQLAQLTSQAIHGFDSFEGLPEAWHNELKGSYTTEGVIPKVASNVTLHQGWFDNTLPVFIKQHKTAIRLLNIDCDIYASTKTVLDELAPQIQLGTVIIFDEYIGNEHWKEDEFKAFQEAVIRYRWQYEYLAFSFFTKQVVVKIL